MEDNVTTNQFSELRRRKPNDKNKNFECVVNSQEIVRIGWWLLGAALRVGGASFQIHPVVFISFYVNGRGVVIVYCSPWYDRPSSVS